MTFILISGDMNTGKTHVCNKLHSRIAEDQSFKVLNEPQNVSNTSKIDFISHYEKSGKYIVLNSPSDDDRRMTELAKYLDGLAAKGVRPDAIITTVRENNNGGYQMSRMFALLDAFANGTPNLEHYYIHNIKSITSFAPTSLVHHAFEFHLKKLQLSGSKVDKENALMQYWEDCADGLKYVLDFALAHL
ncbi:MAG: hypothetical protein HDR33_06460 [Treponema sp.]|nr:hypothetical protein [Treponema sp.]